MAIKYITLFLLAFTCTPSTHACSGPGPENIVIGAGAICVAEWWTLATLNSPLINAKRLELKRNLTYKNIVLSAAVGTATSMALTLGGGLHYNKDTKKYSVALYQASNNLFPCFFASAILTTIYNIYQCTKEEPRKPAQITLPAHINPKLLEPLYQKNQLTDRDNNDN